MIIEDSSEADKNSLAVISVAFLFMHAIFFIITSIVSIYFLTIALALKLSTITIAIALATTTTIVNISISGVACIIVIDLKPILYLFPS